MNNEANAAKEAEKVAKAAEKAAIEAEANAAKEAEKPKTTKKVYDKWLIDKDAQRDQDFLDNPLENVDKFKLKIITPNVKLASEMAETLNEQVANTLEFYFEQ